MTTLVVVDNPKTWHLKLPDVAVVSARAYLTDPQYSQLRGVKVFNLCKSYRYQSAGYYVSLLAMARRHKVLPGIVTIQDMKALSITRIMADDVSHEIQRLLKPLKSDVFVLSIYFGRNLAHRYDELSQRLFRLFPAPLMRIELERRDGEWRVSSVHPLAASDIPPAHYQFVEEAARAFFQRNRMPTRQQDRSRYDLAILVNRTERFAPSDKVALRKIEAAARRHDLTVEFIERDDYGRLAEFDALLIRETTAVNHHTYRFARRAVAEGLVVIDDPDSIAQCTNKVYLAELLGRHKIATPKTLIVHRDNGEEVRAAVGLPCILKQPDSSFSQGVVKVADETELAAALERLLDSSDLVIAQEFMPTEFDWRIGVLDREPLYACKYFMAKSHWQIAKNEADSVHYGPVEAVPLDSVPPVVLNTAVRAARLIGDGLYGVDVKHIGSRAYIIEVNDNPTIDGGNEDRILGDELYDRLIRVFVKRLQSRSNGASRSPA